MEIRKRNPFRLSYLGIAAMCCLALSIIFYFTNHVNNVRSQRERNSKKAELIMEDLKANLQLMEEVSMRIAISSEYQPLQFKKNKYNERILLEDFKQYRFYSTLVEECFLSYGDDMLFHTSGYTIDLDIFLRAMSETERQGFRQELSAIRERGMAGGLSMLSAAGDLYVLMPVRVSDRSGRVNAVLGFMVGHSVLEERFQIVSGGVSGRLSLYWEDELLYWNQEPACTGEERNALTVSDWEGGCRLVFVPKQESYLQSGLFAAQSLLVLVSIILLGAIANLLAERSYRPIMEMSDRYRGKIANKKDAYANALEEIDDMMDSMLENNVRINAQIEQKQNMLKYQILRMVLEGSASFDVQPYLERLNIRLPGPYYYAVSISFEKEDGITKEFMAGLQRELEELSGEEEKEYVYALCDFRKKCLNVICSIARESRREELTETVCGVAESFSYKPQTGCGKPYQTLSRLPASWLESMDNIHGGRAGRERSSREELSGQTEELYRVCGALAEGNEAGALEGMERFARRLDDNPASILMQQYIFADFLSEVTRLARKCGIELSNQSISLVVSARNTGSFKRAAEDLIRDFCEAYSSLQSQREETEDCRVCEYVREHFKEYDLSIEHVAEELHMTAAQIRQAILRHTGKMYKDYLIHLRIECAKRLLLQGDMTVDEICRHVGYSSLSYFTKLFRENTGATPAKYRSGVL